MVMGAKIIEARTDAAALEVARDFLKERDLEVWTGRRRVGLLQA